MMPKLPVIVRLPMDTQERAKLLQEIQLDYLTRVIEWQRKMKEAP